MIERQKHLFGLIIRTEVLLTGDVRRDEGSLHDIWDGEGRFRYNYFTALDENTLVVESVTNEASPDFKVVYTGDDINRAGIMESRSCSKRFFGYKVTYVYRA